MAKIEGLIVKLKDTLPQATGDFSIAKIQIYSNEEPLVPIDKYTPALKTLKQLKDYYEVDGKTYNLVETMFLQEPCFANVEGAQFQIVPINWTDATQTTIKSIPISITTFKGISNGSLRLKIESSLNAKSVDLQTNNKEEAMIKLAQNYNGNITDEDGVITKAVDTSGNMIGLKQSDASDVINKYTLENDKNGNFKAVANNTHYKEVNGIDFTGCEDLNDVVNILNHCGFNAVFELVDDKYICIKTKGLGSRYNIVVESAISPDVVIDLKNVCFGAGTSGITTTKNISENLTNLQALGDCALSIEVDGVAQTRYNFDFTSATTFDDIANILTEGGNTTEGTSPVVKTPFTGCIISATENGISIKSSTTGSSSSVVMIPISEEDPLALTGTDLYGENYFDGENQISVEGTDGAETTQGTDGAGDSIVEKYQEYEIYPDFFGSVITTTAKMSIENIYNLNNELKASAKQGHRVVAIMTLQDPYDVEATSHGALAEWLDTRYLSLYCGGLTGLADIELRGAVISMSCGQDVFVSTKNDLHMKNVVVPHSSLNDISFTNEMIEMVNEAGAGALCYFKGGYGWKLTIPSNADVFTSSDMVNMHNIAMTFSFALANQLAIRKYTNKTNNNIEAIHQVLYNLCLDLTRNGVLTGDVSDFSGVIGNIQEAKKMIQTTQYHSYMYSPNAMAIKGKRIPITAYLGFAGSVYGFELENVYLV